MKFSYKKIESVFRPIIPVTLIFNNQTFSTEALVDSGADICVFDHEIGEALGVDIQKGKEDRLFGVTGVGEKIFHHELAISVGGHERQAEIAFFSQSHGYSHGFLGQRGFFEMFTVKFDYTKKEIEVKPSNSSKLSLRN